MEGHGRREYQNRAPPRVQIARFPKSAKDKMAPTGDCTMCAAAPATQSAQEFQVRLQITGRSCVQNVSEQRWLRSFEDSRIPCTYPYCFEHGVQLPKLAKSVDEKPDCGRTALALVRAKR